MLKIYTVCGNGIGSSLMCKFKIEEICKEMGLQAVVESTDFSSAQGMNADLYITIAELAAGLADKNVAVIRSYTNKKKILEDVEASLLALKK